jgi:hypothetical protein
MPVCRGRPLVAVGIDAVIGVVVTGRLNGVGGFAKGFVVMVCDEYSVAWAGWDTVRRCSGEGNLKVGFISFVPRRGVWARWR